jgi:hypothetical protein
VLVKKVVDFFSEKLSKATPSESFEMISDVSNSISVISSKSSCKSNNFDYIMNRYEETQLINEVM